MASYQERMLDFQEIIEADIIDFERLRKLTFRVGCPDQPWLRSVVWKLLLKYLPVVKSDWQAQMNRHRSVYRQFVEEVLIKPGARESEQSRVDVTMEDHPLNPHPESKWSQYFNDNEMLVQIDKDCRRLCPGLAFFQNAALHSLDVLTKASGSFETLRHRVERSVLKSQNVSKNRYGITTANFPDCKKSSSADDLVALDDGQEANWEVVERILFVYAKLNPGHGYVQGMNEVIGPIYYALSHDPDPACQAETEADTFWCFTNLMSEIRDNFIKHLDHDAVFGIGVLMRKFEDSLKDADVTLWLKLQQLELKPEYYAFRWLTLLLSQEFELPDVLRLWDSLFADRSRFDFLINVCCAMLILVRDDILAGDFAANMKLVQRYPPIDINVILGKAVELAGLR